MTDVVGLGVAPSFHMACEIGLMPYAIFYQPNEPLPHKCNAYQSWSPG